MRCGKALGAERMIIDTTVFVDLFRNRTSAQEYLLSLDNINISRAVQMELIQGLKNKRDIAILEKQLRALGVEIVEIDKEISEKAGELFALYHHAHGLSVMDALVAATALVRGESLASHNTKHFRFIKDLELIVPY